MNKKVIIFPEPNKAELISGEIPDLSRDQVLVEYDYSAISAGTELANYLHLPNTLRDFPKYPGYSACGRVIEKGSDVSTLDIGDRVIINWGGHTSHIVRSPEEAITSAIQRPLFKGLVKVENNDIDSVEAAFTHIASFPLLGVRKLNIAIGESVMIAGCGLLGLIAVQFARLSGAYPVMAIDFSPERRELAKKLGADLVFDPADPDVVEQIKAATKGRGANAVVEVTGNAKALAQALEYVALEGRISLLGCTRVSDVTIDYYKYVHTRGIHLIGAHTFTRPRMDDNHTAWSEQSDYRTILNLLAAGRITFKPFISKLVSPADAAQVYELLATEKNPPLGVVFDWSLVR